MADPEAPAGSAVATPVLRAAPNRMAGSSSGSAAAGGPGLRPGDLVGAIANEAGVPGSVVGAIQLFDDFALVDVQGNLADSIEHALRNATIRGQKLPVRRERSPSRR